MPVRLPDMGLMVANDVAPLDHRPPELASVKATLFSPDAHTTGVPPMAVGCGFTVMIAVAKTLPQELLFV